MPHTTIPVLSILGPTATGKSALAVTAAKQLDGEVISADSRQVYRELNIGTAKITADEQQGIPHHLIDIRSVTEQYTAAHFARDANTLISDIASRGRRAIVAGGTVFYHEVLRGHIPTTDVPPNPPLRAELERYTAAELVARLQHQNPKRAASIDAHNRRRLIRALEIAAAGDRQELTPSVNVQKTAWFTVALWLPQETLRERFRLRAQRWLDAGLLEEAAELQQHIVTPERFREIGFEYTLAAALAANTITREDFLEQFVAKNWQYAKRQYTWLRRLKEVYWLRADDEAARVLTLSRIADWYKQEKK